MSDFENNHNNKKSVLFFILLNKIKNCFVWLVNRIKGLGLKEDLKKVFGHLRPRQVTAFVLVGALGVYLISGVYMVNPGEQAVERLWGKVIRAGITEGIHYSLPWPFQKVDKVNTSEIQRESIGIVHSEHTGMHNSPEKIQVLTGDENIVDVEMIIQYRISDPEAYLFNVDYRSFQLINEAVRYAATKIAGSMEVDNILTVAKEEIQKQVQVEAQNLLNAYKSGISIVTVNLNKLYPPDELADSFQDVSSAREDKLREISQAEGYRNGLIPPAKGEAEKNIRTAEAYKIDVINRANGEARRFLSMLTEYRTSNAGTGSDVTRNRLYFETMERVMQKVNKYIVKDPGGKVNLRFLGNGG
jgi:membrane protease subunit HflK